MNSTFLALSFFLIISNACFSQLKPAKDPENCSYGLKDETGKWIVEPYFTNIKLIGNSRFFVTDINFDGVLNSDGSVLIPAIYDEINVQANFYLVRKGNLWTVFSGSGTQLFDFNYTHIDSDFYSKFYLYRKSGDSTFTTFADIFGQILIPETNGYILPFGERKVTAIGEYYKNGIFGNAGLIDLTGKIVRERIYKSIKVCENTFIVTSDNGVGYISYRNEMLLEPDYPIGYLNSSGFETPCVYPGRTYEVHQGNKVGLMDGEYKIVIPPAYDKIASIPGVTSSDSARYMAKKNGKWGLLSLSGSELTAQKYDSIYLSRFPAIISRSLQNGLYFCEQDGKIEVRNNKDELIIPGSFDSFTNYSTGKKNYWLLANGNVITVFDPRNDTTPTFILKETSQVDSIKIYFLNGQLLPFAVRKKGGIPMLFPLIVHVNKSGNFFLLNVYKNPQERRIYVFDKGGHHIPFPGLLNVENIFIDNRSLLQYESGVHLWNSRTGQVLTDTLYASMEIQSRNLIRARKYDPDSRLRVYPLDSNGRHLSDTGFDNIFDRRGTQIATRKGRFGVVGENYDWIIKPTYHRLSILNDDYLLVTTSSGKTGIIDFNETLIVDTVFKSFHEVFCNYIMHDPISKKSSKVNVFMFESDSAQLLYTFNEVLLDSRTDGSAAIRERLIDYTYSDSNITSGFKISSGGSLTIIPHKSIITPVFREIVYDSLHALWDSRNRDLQHGLSDNSYSSAYFVSFIGEKFCSFASDSEEFHYYPSSSLSSSYFGIREIDKVYNLIYTGSEFKSVTLNDLFSSDEEKERMVRTAIKRTLREEECMSPELPAIEHFFLRKEGIELRLNDKRILLPLEDLEKESTRWILEYLE